MGFTFRNAIVQPFVASLADIVSCRGRMPIAASNSDLERLCIRPLEAMAALYKKLDGLKMG